MFLDLSRDVICSVAVSDCVSTPFALRPQHGTPAPPLPVICVRLMMMSRMNSMLFSTAHTPIQCLFAGDTSPYSQRQEHRMFLLFCTRTTTNSTFFCMNYFFYEQASSHTLWLKAFPCKPCRPVYLVPHSTNSIPISRYNVTATHSRNKTSVNGVQN